MTYEDDTRDLVRRAGDAVPVSPAPVETLLQQGHGAHRRRTTTTIGVVAAAVLAVTSGAVAVGTQLTRDAGTHATSTPIVSDGTLVPSPGTRLVGRNGVAVAVPTAWRTSETLCDGAVVLWQIPELYRGSVGCAPQSKTRSIMRIEPYRDQAKFYEPWAKPAGRIGGTAVERYGPEDSCAHTDFTCLAPPLRPLSYVGVLLDRQADVLIYVRSSTAAEVTKILDTAFEVPENYVTVTADSSSGVPVALRAAGLQVTQRMLYQQQLPEGSLLSSKPDLGSVVARGSDVAVAISTQHQLAHCWAAPVEVVTPTASFRPNQGYGYGRLTVHVGDHLTLRTIGPCGDDASFVNPAGSVLTRLNSREVIATSRGTVRLGVIRPGAPGIGDVEVRVRP